MEPKAPEEKHTHPAQPTGHKVYRWYHVTGIEPSVVLDDEPMVQVFRPA